MCAFLKNIKLTELTDSMRKELDEPEHEIIEAIKMLKSNKSPGPDGDINGFYKKLKEIISPLLLRAYHHSLDSGELAPSWREATIVVLYKEGKDPVKCQSYRPVSLLNSDLCILTTILSKRVNKIINHIIHPYQTGFIAERFYGDNLRRALNIMSHVNHKKEKAMLLSLDAYKAFDRVSWQYLFQILERFEFGPGFIKWV